MTSFTGLADNIERIRAAAKVLNDAASMASDVLTQVEELLREAELPLSIRFFRWYPGPDHRSITMGWDAEDQILVAFLPICEAPEEKETERCPLLKTSREIRIRAALATHEFLEWVIKQCEKNIVDWQKTLEVLNACRGNGNGETDERS